MTTEKDLFDLQSLLGDLGKGEELPPKELSNGIIKKALSPEACFVQGMDFYQGSKDVRKDVRKAIPLFRKAAKQGYTPAERQMGFILVTGSADVKQDISKGLAFLESAEAKGDRVACSIVTDIKKKCKEMVQRIYKQELEDDPKNTLRLVFKEKRP